MMPEFKILDNNKQAISINELDKEAAFFWGKVVDLKEYATPLHEPAEFKTFKERMDFSTSNTNWFDAIGWRIANNGLTSWEQVRTELLAPISQYNLTEEELAELLPAYKGYLDLIKHWEEKGYTPYGYTPED